MNGFSLRRLSALLRKEWIQVRRDPMTLRLIIALPIMQLFLFGYAINANPKHLPTGLLLGEPSKYERTIVTALQKAVDAFSGFAWREAEPRLEDVFIHQLAHREQAS